VAVALIHSNFGHSVFLVQLYDKKKGTFACDGAIDCVVPTEKGW